MPANLAIYVGQETLEIAIASQSAASFHDAFGHSGWVAVPLAVAIGGLVALASRGAHAAVAFAARAGPRRPTRARPRRRWRVPAVLRQAERSNDPIARPSRAAIPLTQA